MLIAYQGNLQEIQCLVPAQTDGHAKLRDNRVRAPGRSWWLRTGMKNGVRDRSFYGIVGTVAMEGGQSGLML